MTTSTNEVECLVENSSNLSISGEKNTDNNNNNTNENNNNNQTNNEPQQPPAIDQNLVKHPLQCKWSLWYDFHNNKVSQDNWANALKKIISFDTVEDFWCVFNNLPQVSSIKSGSSFHLFKDDIEPKWEHEANKRGGKWLFQIKDKSQADNYWLQVVMACVGETFDSSDEICGLVYNSRRAGDKISIWTRHSNEKATLDVGRGLKSALELSQNQTIGYSLHFETSKKNLYDV